MCCTRLNFIVEHLSQKIITPFRVDDAAEESDASSSDMYFDCSDGSSLKHKPSIIRWSSELELEIVDERESSIG